MNSHRTSQALLGQVLVFRVSKALKQSQKSSRTAHGVSPTVTKDRTWWCFWIIFWGWGWIQRPNSGYCELPNYCQDKCGGGGGGRGVEGGSGARNGGYTSPSSPPPLTWLTLNVFLPTITILFLIVGQLGLLVGLILTHVPIVPIVVRQL